MRTLKLVMLRALRKCELDACATVAAEVSSSEARSFQRFDTAPIVSAVERVQS
jgi:hypothetical protein